MSWSIACPLASSRTAENSRIRRLFRVNLPLTNYVKVSDK